MASPRVAVGYGRVVGAHWILAVLGLVVGMLAATGPQASAAVNQFTWFDATVTHRSDTYAEPAQLSGVPADWTSPVNFANGRVYLRIEVTRPTTKAVDVQICVWRNRFVEETCGSTSPLASNGVQWIDSGQPSRWWKKDGSWSWTTPFSPVRLMLKDPVTGKLLLSSRCGVSCYTGTDLEDHLPITLTTSAIVVAPGATLSPPPSWAGCPAAWSPACASGTTNAPPVVNAGSDLAGTIGEPVTVNGTASDDGLPEGSTLTTSWAKASGPGDVTFSADTPATTAVFSAAGDYTIRLSASDGALTASDTARVTITGPPPPITGTAALVSKSAVPPAPDRLLQDRLRGLGYEVTVVDDNLVRSTDLSSFDLVVVAPSVAANTIPTSLGDLGVPLLSLRPQVHRRLSLGTGGTLLSGQTTLDIVAEHPIAAGLSGLTRVSASTSIGRAVPVAGAVVVATPVNRPTEATLFAVETGTQLVARVAPARRVGFYLSPGAPSRLQAAGWQLFDAAVDWLDPSAPPTPDPWQVEALSRRVVLTVSPQGVARDGEVAAVSLTGTSAGVFDPATLRVVEVDAAGEIIDDTVAIQFDPAVGFDGEAVRNGTLVLSLEGSTTGNRRYHVYYGDAGEEVAPPVAPQVTLTEGVVDEGHPSLLVETPTGDWWYHTLGGGFSSLVDTAGQDWIAWNDTPGSAGTFRGIPNAVFPAGYLHPGFTNSTTEVVAAGPLRVSFVSETDNGDYRVRWDVTALHARMTVLRAAANYWFLYEGLPGGEIDPTNDKVIRPNGTVTNLSAQWSGDIAGEWAAFADPADGRSLFVGQSPDDTIIDSYRLMQNNMTVFGFGRDSLNSLLSGQREFVVGLVDDTGVAGIGARVAAARTPYGIIAGSAEDRPAAG